MVLKTIKLEFVAVSVYKKNTIKLHAGEAMCVLTSRVADRYVLYFLSYRDACQNRQQNALYKVYLAHLKCH